MLNVLMVLLVLMILGPLELGLTGLELGLGPVAGLVLVPCACE